MKLRKKSKNYNFLRKITYLSAVIIFFSGNFGSGFAAVISPPVIAVNPDIYYPNEEVLYLEGLAEPMATVQIRFQKQGERPLTFNVKADQRGEWVLAEKVPLAAGDWEIRSRIVDPTDLNNVSDWSNPRIFRVIISGINIGRVNITFAFLSLIILVLFFIGSLITILFALRLRKLKILLVSKEINEAEKSVQKGFTELRERQLEELRNIQANQNLSVQEIEKRKHFISDLDNLEHGIEKEIQDIREKL